MTLSDVDILIAVEVPSAPLPLRMNLARSALAEMCRATRAWRAPLTLTLTEAETPITGLPAHSRPSLVVGDLVSTDRRHTIRPASRDVAARRWQRDAPNEPTLFYLEGSLLKLDARPIVPRDYRFELVLEPANTQTQIPDVLDLADMDLAIARGALARLFGMASREWFNAELAVQRRVEFQNDLQRFSARLNAGSTEAEEFVRITPAA